MCQNGQKALSRQNVFQKIKQRFLKKKKKEKALCWNNNKENVAVHDFSFMDSWRH